MSSRQPSLQRASSSSYASALQPSPKLLPVRKSSLKSVPNTSSRQVSPVRVPAASSISRGASASSANSPAFSLTGLPPESESSWTAVGATRSSSSTKPPSSPSTKPGRTSTASAKDTTTSSAKTSRKQSALLGQRPIKPVFHTDVKANSPNTLSAEQKQLVSATKKLFAEEFNEVFEEQISRRGKYRLSIMADPSTNDLLSFIMYKTCPASKTLKISFTAVPKVKRRQGYGKAMFKWMLKYAKNQSRSVVEQVALSSMASSVKFYCSLGFKKESGRLGEEMAEEMELVAGQVLMVYRIRK